MCSVQAVMAQLPVEQQARLAKKAEELSLEQEKWVSICVCVHISCREFCVCVHISCHEFCVCVRVSCHEFCV